MKLRFALLFLVIASISACVKAPSYPIEPVITFKSVASSESVIYMNGTIPIYIADTLTVSFTDGDGDISVYGDPSDSNLCVDPCAYRRGDTSCLNIKSKNVFIVDSRDSCIATY